VKGYVLSDWVASVGKVGTLPLAPGTWGSFVALVFWYFLIDRLSPIIFILLIAVIFVVGVITSSIVEKTLNLTDPSRVVIDEWVGQWIALIMIPKTVAFGIGSFLLFRLLDVWKPGPIRRLGDLPGGWGIMLDDVGAGFAALILLQAIRWLV
jgi:phosphatidylglycerophosphatase A